MNSLFHLVLGSANVGVWVFFREKCLNFSSVAYLIKFIKPISVLKDSGFVKSIFSNLALTASLPNLLSITKISLNASLNPFLSSVEL